MAYPFQIVFDIILWVAVPAILIIAIVKASHLSRHADDEKRAAAARSGFWGGIVLSLIVLIYQANVFVRTGFPNRDLFQGFDLWLALTGAIVAYLLSLGGKRAVPTKLVGLIVLLLTFLSFYALIHYLLIRTYNDVVLSLVLGATFGILLHYTASPPTTFGTKHTSTHH